MGFRTSDSLISSNLQESQTPVERALMLEKLSFDKNRATDLITNVLAGKSVIQRSSDK